MVNPEHLALLKQGVEAWNAWTWETDEPADLSTADLSGVNLSGADLRGADLQRANLSKANLSQADLSWANLLETDISGANLAGADLSGVSLPCRDLSKVRLYRANLSEADLSQADLSGVDLSKVCLFRADLSEANLSRANLTGATLDRADLSRADLSGANLTWADLINADLTDANLTGANLTGADLQRATLVQATLRRAQLRGCRIFATSVWLTELEDAIQKDLIITRPGEDTITVDSLEVAQFIYLLLHNSKIRQVVDTITSKLVLILGRFTPERKAVLDRLREELRQRGFLPVLFDFEGPESRDVNETVSTLAHMARFVVADLTDPRSIPQELQKIVPQLPSVPVQPILLEGQQPWGMFPHFERYPWVLPPYRYTSLEQLVEALSENVIAPAVRKVEELRVVPS